MPGLRAIERRAPSTENAKNLARPDDGQKGCCVNQGVASRQVWPALRPIRILMNAKNVNP